MGRTGRQVGPPKHLDRKAQPLMYDVPLPQQRGMNLRKWPMVAMVGVESLARRRDPVVARPWERKWLRAVRQRAKPLPFREGRP